MPYLAQDRTRDGGIDQGISLVTASLWLEIPAMGSIHKPTSPVIGLQDQSKPAEAEALEEAGQLLGDRVWMVSSGSSYKQTQTSKTTHALTIRSPRTF